MRILQSSFTLVIILSCILSTVLTENTTAHQNDETDFSANSTLGAVREPWVAKLGDYTIRFSDFRNPTYFSSQMEIFLNHAQSSVNGLMQQTHSGRSDPVPNSSFKYTEQGVVFELAAGGARLIFDDLIHALEGSQAFTAAWGQSGAVKSSTILVLRRDEQRQTHMTALGVLAVGGAQSHVVGSDTSRRRRS